ncbi:MAG: BON domain-containing protein, partial [Chloroflexota bacterium]
MKNDADLQHDVLNELDYEPSLEAQAIGVIVREGVVTLTGHVQTYSDKYTAETAAKRVAGVRAIAEEMTVSLFSGHERNDSDIAQAVASALDGNVNLPLNKVHAAVENGWITLSGAV